MNRIQHFPNYFANADSPVLSADKSIDIAIDAPGKIKLSNETKFPLYGSFVLPEEMLNSFDFHIMQAVVIVIRGPFPASRQVGEDDLFFNDDIKIKEGKVSGYFNLDLFEHFNLIQYPNTYWVSASLFGEVSNVVTVEVIR